MIAKISLKSMQRVEKKYNKSDIMDRMIESVGHGGRVRCEPGWSLTANWSKRLPDHDLWLVWAGRGRMRLGDGSDIDLYPGVLVWARPGGLYLAEQESADRLGVRFQHFTPKPGMPEPPQWLWCRDLAYVESVLGRLEELHESGNQGLACKLLEALVVDLLSRHKGKPDAEEVGRGGVALHHETVARSAAALIAESPGEDWQVAELARRFGYSPDHFARVFQQEHQITPRAYIITQRLTRARTLLLESPMSVAQVAEVLGYDSAGYFCRQFKQRFGESPGRFRRTAPLF